MAYGTTPVSTTGLGTNQFPASSVYTPGTANGNFTALQGGPVASADASGNVSAPAAVYLADGNDVTQGTSTDAAGHASVIGQLKQISTNTTNAAAAAGGTTPYHNVVSSGTNGTNVKASAGQVYDGVVSNTSASAVYFRLYDIASAPTVGTTAVKRTIQVPGNGTVIFSWPNGLKFTAGISWGITAAIADADTTAISAAVSVDFGYV